jgi:hypothetical protein
MAIKITIEQIDIESAIREYIASMMEIKPDAHLDIDLSATRGSAGFTATVIIRSANEIARETASVTQIPITQDADSPVAPVGIANIKVDGRTKAAKALNIPKMNENAQVINKTNDLAHLPIEEVKEVPVDIEVEANQVEEAVTQEDVEQSTEAAPRASLFGGLTKPKN